MVGRNFPLPRRKCVERRNCSGDFRPWRCLTLWWSHLGVACAKISARKEKLKLWDELIVASKEPLRKSLSGISRGTVRGNGFTLTGGLD